MAKKTTAKKQKTSEKKTKKYDKSNRTRCSPSDVAELIKDLGDKQMECVREMGFGALEHLSTTNMSKQLMMELVDCFNTKDNTMRTTLGIVKLDATKVAHALGLNGRGNGTYLKKNSHQDAQRRAKSCRKNVQGCHC
ncbi:hypothetical protein PIB30_072358 [Stylosanthes scabra]|uniref:Uncharacterized protein n=1 Tax=Stylosanthes scabra TaxID=79078 RepID=A0ABU6VMH1_9FABA|nr:hypothetical protein [Stylosanthes scabra]